MNPIFRAINFTLITILRSPWHGLLSRNLMLITVTSRQSRRTYTVPVSYQLHADEVRIISERHDHWWRNLRGGAPVMLQLQGHEVHGQANVIERVNEVLPLLTEHVQQSPNIARMLNIRRNDQSQFRLQDLQCAAEQTVVVLVEC